MPCGEDGALGRTRRDAPEVDGRVLIEVRATGRCTPGAFVEVKMTGVKGYDLVGTLTSLMSRFPRQLHLHEGAPMNLPNAITLGRFAMALVLFGYLIYTDTCAGPSPWPPAIAGGAFIIVVATDALDGYLARKLNQQTDFGRIADPVVDKVLVCGRVDLPGLGRLGARATLPVWLVVLVISREFMVSGLRGFIESRGHAFPARWDGKLKMVLQCVVVPAVFLQRMLDLGWPGEHDAGAARRTYIAIGSIWLMFAVTLTSGARYVMAAAKVLKADSA